jgi:hypothetical protein
MGKTLTIAFGVLIAIVIMFVLVGNAMAKQEEQECKQWAKQSKEYTQFFYAPWQKAQCGIK